MPPVSTGAGCSCATMLCQVHRLQAGRSAAWNSSRLSTGGGARASGHVLATGSVVDAREVAELAELCKLLGKLGLARWANQCGRNLMAYPMGSPSASQGWLVKCSTSAATFRNVVLLRRCWTVTQLEAVVAVPKRAMLALS